MPRSRPAFCPPRRDNRFRSRYQFFGQPGLVRTHVRSLTTRVNRWSGARKEEDGGDRSGRFTFARDRALRLLTYILSDHSSSMRGLVILIKNTVRCPPTAAPASFAFASQSVSSRKQPIGDDNNHQKLQRKTANTFFSSRETGFGLAQACITTVASRTCSFQQMQSKYGVCAIQSVDLI